MQAEFVSEIDSAPDVPSTFHHMPTTMPEPNGGGIGVARSDSKGNLVIQLRSFRARLVIVGVGFCGFLTLPARAQSTTGGSGNVPSDLPPPPMPPPLPEEPTEPETEPPVNPPSDGARPIAPSDANAEGAPTGTPKSVGEFPPAELAGPGATEPSPTLADGAAPPPAAEVRTPTPTTATTPLPRPAAAPTADPVSPEPSSPVTPSSLGETTQPAEAHKKNNGPRVFFGVGGALTLGTTSSHEWASTCPSVTLAGTTILGECATASPIGGAVDILLGVRGKYIGGEVFFLGAADYSSATLSLGEQFVLPEFANGTHIGRAGAGGGLGVRGFVEANMIGLSFGVGGGAIWRSVFTNLSSTGGEFEQYAAPLLRFDAEVSLLKVFQLGFLGFVEFAPDVTIRPDLTQFTGSPELNNLLGDITVFRGTQVFLGPYIGLRTP
jgi:hypothetical protein